MLGDTAVAVNPKDERYMNVRGAMLMLPIAGREIPVIVDDFVDREFGTGAVKVTPAHDPNDFLMGLRHAMEPVVVMDEGGRMAGSVPEKYRGVDRFTARAMVVEDLTGLGLVEKIEPHRHAVSHCYRCHTVVEPCYSDQWFVRMKPLAEGALRAALDDRLRFYPPRWKRTYIEWMENIRDWCISRQIWWGHRIPVWYCPCGETIVEEEAPERCPRCNGAALRQDNDVLDTWFSSWLWPFSTMGWPEPTGALRKFYPTDALMTAPEIIFFWVARMIMAGLHFTGTLPFTDILLHGTVRDKSGRKMSKSLGNALDPMEVIPVYGADAVRFSMIMITAQGADVFLGKDTFDIGRNFANKLWNASRFLLSTIEGRVTIAGLPPGERRKAEDRWILSRLQEVIDTVTSAITGYRANEAAHTIYDFTWHEFCDWFVEAKKADIYQSDDEQRKNDAWAVAVYVLGSILKLLHPIMPFITEEIWSHLRDKAEFPGVIDARSIMVARYPIAESSLLDAPGGRLFTQVIEIVTALRTIRSENNVPPDKIGRAIVIPATEADAALLRTQTPLVNQLARLSETVIDPAARRPSFAGSAVAAGMQLYLLLEGIIDRNVETDRLTKEIARVNGLIENTKKRLESDSFVSRAPAEIVAKEKEKFEGLLANKEKLGRSLAAIEGFGTG